MIGRHQGGPVEQELASETHTVCEHLVSLLHMVNQPSTCAVGVRPGFKAQRRGQALPDVGKSSSSGRRE